MDAAALPPGKDNAPAKSTPSEDDPLWLEAIKLNEQWRGENKYNMSRFTKDPIDPNATAEARLLRATAATHVFSCSAEDIAFFLDPAQKRAEDDVNAITISMSPASMNFCCTSLQLLTVLATEISNHAEITKEPPNSPVAPEQRMRVLRLKARSFHEALRHGGVAPRI